MKTKSKWNYAAVAALGLTACGGGGDEGNSSALPLSQAPAMVQELAARFNVYRASGVTCGDKAMPPVPPITGYRPQLQEAIQGHVEDMNANNIYSHTGSNGSSIGDRIRKAGYPSTAPYGEIIMKGSQSDEELTKTWIGSPGHCKLIMNEDFESMGAAQSGILSGVNFGH